jgi:hypothetical protein
VAFLSPLKQYCSASRVAMPMGGGSRRTMTLKVPKFLGGGLRVMFRDSGVETLARSGEEGSPRGGSP